MESLPQSYAIRVVSSLLSPGEELAGLEYPQPHPAVLVADLDGDGIPEIAGAYRSKDRMHALIAKFAYGRWHTVMRMRGPGYGVVNMMAAPIVAPGMNALLIGWQIGDIWAQLDMWQANHGMYAHLTPRDIFYSKLEVEDMPGARGIDGLCEIALWVHDTGEAYDIDIWRWERGLVKDEGAYPYYFRNKVVPYYEKLAHESPESSLYERCLKEAEKKAMP
ncbi:hypothetical protein [Cohnella yongneupensis]|uniref:Uncharacterized protein n=1 Tax=Cohnella yongneupensis TaxID=425006 RepID=A0ABW0R1H6_9BACL